MIIVALMGKSGSGKSTAEAALENRDFKRIISYTTRKMRQGEKNHREYHFVTEEQFDQLIKNNTLVEQAEYNGFRYGAPKPIGAEQYVIVTETEGVKSFKKLYGKQVVAIYIDVDDSEISKRLAKRGNTLSKTITERKQVDKDKFSNIENIADYIVDGNGDIQSIIRHILHYVEDWCSKNHLK